MKPDFLYSNRLAGVQEELSQTKNKSTTNLLASEDEILQLKAEFVKSFCTAVVVAINVAHLARHIMTIFFLFQFEKCSRAAGDVQEESKLPG